MSKKSIAVIGQGFVGGSITTVMAERGFDVYTYDISGKQAIGGKHPRTKYVDKVAIGPEPASSVKDLFTACSHIPGFSHVYFVCLPTPMFEDGEADLSIVEGVLKDLEQVANEIGEDSVAVVKSTIPPGSTARWNERLEADDSCLRVVFNPEFLTEANALNDMRNQNRIILGGPRPYINKVKQVFQTAFPDVPIVKTSSTTAEMVKYFTNVQLATRVVLSCELAQVVEALDNAGLNVDYDKVVEYAKYDHRLGGTHMNVPGQDGVWGARGHCFPKDLNALIVVAKKMGVDPTVMTAVWEKNLEVVPEEHRDWEKMVGRAVSRKNKK